MADEPAVTRAHMLAQMASSPSVTTDVLADEQRQFPESRLAGDPPVAYLMDGEAPAYVLTNQKRGIGLGSKRNTTEPDGDRGTVFLVTGERTLALVGQEDGDETFSLPHDSIAWVSAHSGLLANRIELRTPAKAYHCWVERAAPDALLDGVKSFVEERTVESPDPIPGDDEASVISWRGSSVGGQEADRADAEDPPVDD